VRVKRAMEWAGEELKARAAWGGPRDNRQTSWWRITNFVPEGSQRDFVLGLQKG
jgi:hypothetical protein